MYPLIHRSIIVGVSAESEGDPIANLLAGIDDLVDHGTVWANTAGAVTMPARARRELGLRPEAHWRVFGSASLGMALVVCPSQDPADALANLLRGTSTFVGATSSHAV